MYPVPGPVPGAKDTVMSKMHMVPARWLHWVSNKDGQLAVNHSASHEAVLRSILQFLDVETD